MLPKPNSTHKDKKDVTYKYEGAELKAIIAGVEAFFMGRKYRVEAGEPGNATYGIGSDLMRVFFGAFAKRYKFLAQITQPEAGGAVVFRLEKAMSGAMGGLIGHGKMTKEFNAIADAFEAGVS
jgi:hypothetical protein